jgi:very-short-patch-repair endonuclease
METFYGLCILVILAAGVIAVLKELSGGNEDGGYGPSPFKRRRFLMDSNAEYGLFKVLIELYGDKYYIFPQVHYSHLLETSKHDWREFRRLMSRIERKSADFVLCAKADVSPQLVIELDGPTHARASRKERDEFIDAALNGTGLPILHIPVGPYTPESIKKAIDEALGGK